MQRESQLLHDITLLLRKWIDKGESTLPTRRCAPENRGLGAKPESGARRLSALPRWSIWSILRQPCSAQDEQAHTFVVTREGSRVAMSHCAAVTDPFEKANDFA